MRVNNTLVVASIASIPLLYICRRILLNNTYTLISRGTQTKDFPVDIGCQTIVMSDAYTQTLQMSSINTQTDDITEFGSQADHYLCIDDIIHVEK